MLDLFLESCQTRQGMAKEMANQIRGRPRAKKHHRTVEDRATGRLWSSGKPWETAEKIEPPILYTWQIAPEYLEYSLCFQINNKLAVKSGEK